MRPILIIYFLALNILIIGCSQPKKAPSEASPVEDTAVKAEEPAFSFGSEDLGLLKEQVFFFLRENAINLDGNTFVKYEDLKVTSTSFDYTVVLMDRGMMASVAQARVKSYTQSAGMFSVAKQQNNMLLGDTISIKGDIRVANTTKKDSEGKIITVGIVLAGEYQSNFLRAAAYGYGEYERVMDSYIYQQDLIVDLQRPYIFNKNTLFLKAKIAPLTAKDLSGYTNDELAYLRNEIFARHGHSFKTERMKEYFENQSWYVAYFDDATPFLNDFEKKNAQFIRSLES